MSGQDPFAIKGANGALSLVIDERAALEEILGKLRQRLAASPRHFFAGATLRVQTGGRTLTEEEHEAIAETVEAFGISLADPEEETLDFRPGRAKEGGHEERTLYLKRTLRSGQSVAFDGHVVIMGDVNPGAQITCTGDIIVLGALRGVAHAGAAGKADAVVVAFRLEPTQLRIAGHISRAPDGKAVRPEGPEMALVKDGVIQIRSCEA